LNLVENAFNREQEMLLYIESRRWNGVAAYIYSINYISSFVKKSKRKDRIFVYTVFIKL